MADPPEPEQEGTITEILPNSMFRVKLAKGELVLAHVAGNLRNLMTRVLIGDRVRVELSRYHPGRGRITDHQPGRPR
ncbi:MAG: translation initiation factor IF-1 [Vulcanimicrobiota bacterium]